jgi:hypothetical protein
MLLCLLIRSCTPQCAYGYRCHFTRQTAKSHVRIPSDGKYGHDRRTLLLDRGLQAGKFRGHNPRIRPAIDARHSTLESIQLP